MVSKRLQYRWNRIPSASGIQPLPRSSHEISCTPSGDCLVFGGEHVARTPIDSALHLFSFSSNSWTVIEPISSTLPCSRVGHAQSIVGDELFVFGGRQGITMEEKPLNDLWKFNLKSREWISIASSQDIPVWSVSGYSYKVYSLQGHFTRWYQMKSLCTYLEDVVPKED